MSISIDYSKLEDVSKFSSFLDILMNPGQFKQLAEDLKNTAAEYKIAVEAKSKIDKLDAYADELYSKLSVRASELEAGEQKLQEAQETFNVEYKTKVNDMSKKEEDLRILGEKISVLRSEAEDRMNKANAFEDVLQKKSISLNMREASLLEQERILEAKAVKLKDILG